MFEFPYIIISNIMIILHWIVPNDFRNISHGHCRQMYNSHTGEIESNLPKKIRRVLCWSNVVSLTLYVRVSFSSHVCDFRIMSKIYKVIGTQMESDISERQGCLCSKCLPCRDTGFQTCSYRPCHMQNFLILLSDWSPSVRTINTIFK
jgi:hypothetical protein